MLVPRKDAGEGKGKWHFLADRVHAVSSCDISHHCRWSEIGQNDTAQLYCVMPWHDIHCTAQLYCAMTQNDTAQFLPKVKQIPCANTLSNDTEWHCANVLSWHCANVLSWHCANVLHNSCRKSSKYPAQISCTNTLHNSCAKSSNCSAQMDLGKYWGNNGEILGDVHTHTPPRGKTMHNSCAKSSNISLRRNIRDIAQNVPRGTLKHSAGILRRTFCAKKECSAQCGGKRAEDVSASRANIFYLNFFFFCGGECGIFFLRAENGEGMGKEWGRTFNNNNDDDDDVPPHGMGESWGVSAILD